VSRACGQKIEHVLHTDAETPNARGVLRTRR